MSESKFQINGKEMPFSPQELAKILEIFKKSLFEAGEQIVKGEEAKTLDAFLEELKNLN